MTQTVKNNQESEKMVMCYKNINFDIDRLTKIRYNSK